MFRLFISLKVAAGMRPTVPPGGAPSEHLSNPTLNTDWVPDLAGAFGIDPDDMAVLPAPARDADSSPVPQPGTMAYHWHLVKNFPESNLYVDVKVVKGEAKVSSHRIRFKTVETNKTGRDLVHEIHQAYISDAEERGENPSEDFRLALRQWNGKSQTFQWIRIDNLSIAMETRGLSIWDKPLEWFRESFFDLSAEGRRLVEEDKNREGLLCHWWSEFDSDLRARVRVRGAECLSGYSIVDAWLQLPPFGKQ